MWLSKSKIHEYQFCPRRFEFRYIENMPVKEEAVSAIIGKNFHLFFENFFSEVNIGNNMNPLECAEEIRRAALYVAAPMSGDLESFIDFQWTTAKDFFDIIQAFIDAEIARANALSPSMLTDYYYPVEVEKKFKVPELKFRGIIDRIDLDPSLSYTVLDYKTGKPYTNVSKMRKELCFYTIGARELGYDVTYGTMFFPRHRYVFFEKLKPISITYAKKTINSVRESIEKGEFPCRIGFWCKTCPYFDECDLCGGDELDEKIEGN